MSQRLTPVALLFIFLQALMDFSAFATPPTQHINFQDPEHVEGTIARPGETIFVNLPTQGTGGHCYSQHFLPHFRQNQGTLEQALAGYLQCINPCVSAADAAFYASCAATQSDLQCPRATLEQGILSGLYQGTSYSAATGRCEQWAQTTEHSLFNGVDFLFLIDTSSSMRDSEESWIRTLIPELTNLAGGLPAHSRVLLSSHDVREPSRLFKTFDLKTAFESRRGMRRMLTEMETHVESILDYHGSNMEMILEALLERRDSVRRNTDVVAILITDEIDYSENRREADLMFSDYESWQQAQGGRLRLVSSTEAYNQTEGTHSTWDATHLKGRVTTLLGGEIVRPQARLLREAILKHARELLDIRRDQSFFVGNSNRESILLAAKLGGISLNTSQLNFDPVQGKLTIPAAVIAQISRQLSRPPHGLELKIVLTQSATMPSPWDVAPAPTSNTRTERALFWIELMERLVSRETEVSTLRPIALELALRHEHEDLVSARDWVRENASELGLSAEFILAMDWLTIESRVVLPREIGGTPSRSDCTRWQRTLRRRAPIADLRDSDPRLEALKHAVSTRNLLNRVACEHGNNASQR